MIKYIKISAFSSCCQITLQNFFWSRENSILKIVKRVRFYIVCAICFILGSVMIYRHACRVQIIFNFWAALFIFQFWLILVKQVLKKHFHHSTIQIFPLPWLEVMLLFSIRIVCWKYRTKAFKTKYSYTQLHFKCSYKMIQ